MEENVLHPIVHKRYTWTKMSVLTDVDNYARSTGEIGVLDDMLYGLNESEMKGLTTRNR